MNRFLELIAGKQHPFDVEKLKASPSLSAYCALMPFERNDELVWLIDQIGDTLLRHNLRTIAMEHLEHIHYAHSLHIVNAMQQMGIDAVNGDDLARMNKSFAPTLDKLWGDAKRAVLPKLLHWYKQR